MKQEANKSAQQWPNLGNNSERILLTSKKDQLECTASMIKQGRRFLRILDPDLGRHIYGADAFSDSLSHLARQSRFSDIRLLIKDSHLLVKKDHPLLTLCKRLSSSLSIRIINHQTEELPHGFILVDNEGVIIHPDEDHEPSFANFNDRVQVAKLSQRFDDLWHRSYQDPELRSLSL